MQGGAPLIPAQHDIPDLVLEPGKSVKNLPASMTTAPMKPMMKEQEFESSLFGEYNSGCRTRSALRIPRDPLPLATPQEAISKILLFLLADLPQEHAVESQSTAGPQAQAPSSTLPARTFSPQPGFSHAAPVQWGSEAFAGVDFAGWGAVAPTQDAPSFFPARDNVPDVVSRHKRNISAPLAHTTTVPMKIMKGVDASRSSLFKEHESSCREEDSVQTLSNSAPTTEWQPQQLGAAPAAEAGPVQRHAEGGQHRSTAEPVATSAAILSFPGPSASFQGLGKLENDSLQDLLEAPSESKPTATPHPSNPKSAVVQPVQPARRLPPPAPPVPPDTHPYYRLPVLQPAVQVAYFNGPHALSGA